MRKGRSDLGPVAVVGELNFVKMLPKTRSGKIMRRVFKAVILGRDPGDITTIEEEGSVDEARQAWETYEGRARQIDPASICGRAQIESFGRRSVHKLHGGHCIESLLARPTRKLPAILAQW